MDALFWLLLNLITIMILAFYSMEEMALISFNKVRLHYYVSQESKKALWIYNILKNPTKLFATTLIGVNAATFIGSECARKFHEALEINPDLAPLSQIILVIIFGELAPMFAARKYSEHVALLGAPLIYFSSFMLTPLIWLLGCVTKISNIIFKNSENSTALFITHDELQKILVEKDEETLSSENQEINVVTSNIFHLKEKQAHQIMTPLNKEFLISSKTTISDLRHEKISQKYLIVYEKELDNIIGIIYVKDLLNVQGEKRVGTLSIPSWFIPYSTPILDILKQFRVNSERIAIVINNKGKAAGHITFEDILDEIFGEVGKKFSNTSHMFLNRTFNGNITLEELMNQTGIDLSDDKNETLSEWMMKMFEHHPETGEALNYYPYIFTVKETTLLGIATVEITSQIT